MKEEYRVIVESDPDLRFDDKYGSGCYLRETWTVNGVIHRSHGPAVTVRHPLTNRPIQEEFFREGKRHRYGHPAIIVRDHESGNVAMVQFFEGGKQVQPRDPFTFSAPS